MKATALIAAAALVCGTAAFAQQQDTSKANRAEETTQQDHATAGQKVRNTMHKIGQKTRHAFHRAGDKARQIAHREHAKDDTRAMGGPGATNASRDAETARQARMDSAYDNWKNKQEHSR